MLELKLKIYYPDNTAAKIVYQALKIDNEGYVESNLNENLISFRIRSEDAGSMKNTVDDLLMCVKVVENSSNLAASASNLYSNSFSK